MSESKQKQFACVLSMSEIQFFLFSRLFKMVAVLQRTDALLVTLKAIMLGMNGSQTHVQFVLAPQRMSNAKELDAPRRFLVREASNQSLYQALKRTAVHSTLVVCTNDQLV